jgi:hypothetical protein
MPFIPYKATMFKWIYLERDIRRLRWQKHSTRNGNAKGAQKYGNQGRANVVEKIFKEQTKYKKTEIISKNGTVSEKSHDKITEHQIWASGGEANEFVYS